MKKLYVQAKKEKSYKNFIRKKFSDNIYVEKKLD